MWKDRDFPTQKKKLSSLFLDPAVIEKKSFVLHVWELDALGL